MTPTVYLCPFHFQTWQVFKHLIFVAHEEQYRVCKYSIHSIQMALESMSMNNRA